MELTHFHPPFIGEGVGGMAEKFYKCFLRLIFLNVFYKCFLDISQILAKKWFGVLEIVEMRICGKSLMGSEGFCLAIK